MTDYYLNQLWSSSLTPMCVTRPQSFELFSLYVINHIRCALIEMPWCIDKLIAIVLPNIKVAIICVSAFYPIMICMHLKWTVGRYLSDHFKSKLVTLTKIVQLLHNSGIATTLNMV